MAGSVNKVTLIGNLGRDPEIRTFPSGGRVAHFTVATSESWKDKATGEKKEKTEWHRVSILNENLISVAERFLKKGRKVYLEGQLETRKWQDQASGQEKYATEVVLRPYRGELVLIDSQRDGNGNGGYAAGPDPFPSNAAPSSLPDSAASTGLDDEIPF